MDPAFVEPVAAPRFAAWGVPPRAARVGVAAVFFANGVILSNWVPRIPAVQRDLGLSEGQLGVALLGAAVGALAAMPASGWAVARFGSKPVTAATAVLLAATLPLPALASGVATLWLALVGLGAANGALDVAMNAQGVAVERAYGRPILSSFHAAFSFGGLTGAATGGLAAWTGLDPLPHFVAVAVVAGAAGLAASRRLLPARVDAGGAGAGPALVWPPRRLVAVGALAFCCLLGEGAMADWSAVYLDGELEAGPGLAAAGFAAFSLAMAGGRLVGDRLAAAWGPVALARRGGLLVAGSLGAALLIGHPLAAVLGCGGVGAGLAGIVPVVFSAAARTPGIAPGGGIAAVSTMGYAGFLVGPPLIGLVAEVTSLGTALGAVVVMGALIALLAPSTAPAGAGWRPAPGSRTEAQPAEG